MRAGRGGGRIGATSPRGIMDSSLPPPVPSSLDPRMRECPACQRYVMPQKARAKFGWGGPIVLVIGALGILFGGPVGLIVGGFIVGAGLLGLVVWALWEGVRTTAAAPTCPICKGPVPR